jgi:hypothetical protein
MTEWVSVTLACGKTQSLGPSHFYCDAAVTMSAELAARHCLRTFYPLEKSVPLDLVLHLPSRLTVYHAVCKSDETVPAY